MSHRLRANRWGKALRWAVVAALALGVSGWLALASLDSSWGRQRIQSLVNTALQGKLHGRVRVTRLESLGLSGLAGVDATLEDPQGVTVLKVQGLSVAIAPNRWLGWAVDAVRGNPLHLGIESITLAQIHVHLLSEGDGQWTIEKALSPTSQPATSEPEAAPNLSAAVARFAIGQLSVAVDAPERIVDGTLVDFACAVRWTEGALTLDRLRGALEVADSTASERLTANVRGHIQASSSDPPTLQVDATADGTIHRAQWPEPQPVQWSLAANGPDQDLQWELQATRGHQQFSASGRFSSAEASLTEWTLRGENLNWADWSAQAVATQVHFDASGDLDLSAPLPRGTFRLRTLPSGTVAGHPLPVVELDATAADGHWRVAATAPQYLSHLTLDADWPPTESSAADWPRAATVSVQGHLDDRLNQLPSVRQLSSLTGSLDLSGSSHVQLSNPPQLRDARATLRAVSLSFGEDLKVSEGLLQLSAEGPLDALQGGAELSLQTAHTPWGLLPSVALRAEGSAQRISVAGRFSRASASTVRFGGNLDFPGQSASDVWAKSWIEGHPIAVAVQSLTWGEDQLTVENAAITGAGTLHVNASHTGARTQLEAEARRLNLKRLGQLLGTDLPLSGELSVQAEAALVAGQVRGHLDTSLRNGKYAAVALPEASLSLTSDSNGLSAEAQLKTPDGDRAQIRVSGVPQPTHWARWAQSRAKGRVEVSGRLRPAPWLQKLPSASKLALEMAAFEPGGLPLGADSVKFHALFDFEREAHAGFEWADAQATPLLTGDVAVRLPAGRSFANLSKVDWRLVPGRARVQLHATELAQLTRPWAKDLTPAGRVQAVAWLEGSLAKPSATLRVLVEAESLAVQGGSAPAPPLTAQWTTTLRDTAVDSQLRAAMAHRKVGSVHFRGRLASLLDNPGENFFPESLDARLNALPLSLADSWLSTPISGDLYSSIRATLGPQPFLDATVWSADLSVGEVSPQSTRAHLQATNQGASATVTLSQSAGHATAKFQVPFTNGFNSLPQWQKANVAARLTHFDLGLLNSLASPAVRDIAGYLDGQLLVHEQLVGPAVGTLTLREGSAYVEALGQPLTEIQGALTLSEDGTAEVRELSARSVEGQVFANAQAKLSGLRLESASANVRIPRDKPIPISAQGAPLGDLWGKLDVQLRRASPASDAALLAELQVPQLHFHLPQLPSNEVQSLEPPEHIATGVRVRPAEFMPVPLHPEYALVKPDDESPQPANSWQLEVSLGDNIWITQGEMLKVQLAGDLLLRSGPPLSVTGQLQVPRGTLNVQGKRFEVEQGTLTFPEQGKPSNPVVVATAAHDTSDTSDTSQSYTIYAEFVGPVKSGQLTLRSEPELSQDQILSLLLLGSPDAALGNGPQQESGERMEGAAVSAGSELLTRGLNKQLAQLTTLDIRTRIAESQGHARPEITFVLGPRLTARLSYALSVPDSTRTPDRTFVTLHFRLARDWLVESTLGDKGTVIVDMLWRRRY